MQFSTRLTFLHALFLSLALVSASPDMSSGNSDALEARDGAAGACEDGEFHCDGKTLHKCDHKGERVEINRSLICADIVSSLGQDY